MKLTAISLVAAAAVFFVSVPPAHAQVGASYCLGVGCPCGNDDPLAGCGNRGSDSLTSTGGWLFHSGGTASALQDGLEFSLFGLAANQMGLLYMGGGTGQVPFGDGLRCVMSGGQGLHRYPVQQADFFGEMLQQNIVSLSQGFLPSGQIQPGDTWYYQGWYRDPGGPCGTGFNLTNAIPVSFFAIGGGGNHSQLAGQPLTEYPWFEYTTAINQGEPVYIAIDPGLQPTLIGTTAEVYVVATKDRVTWSSDPTLVDVRGASSPITFDGANVQGNTFLLDSGMLAGTIGAEVGIGYDVVIDVNGNGLYDAGEPIDGRSDDAGFYIVRDVAAAGPYGVVEVIYSGGSWLGQDLYYPANIASLGEVPLVVVSHGNGHNYQWYDHIGEHLASYGYVVMSHQNNTQPGVFAASTTTLTNTDYFLGNLATIAGGVLLSHIDSSRITWIGHSRGGEGVLRAYTRINVGGYVTNNFSAADVKLISSIAPVTFTPPANSDPDEVNYHLWVGAADNDVTGLVTQTHQYALMERADGNRSSITLQGVGHGAFHDGSGGTVSSGPCLLNRPTTHTIMRGQLLPLVKHHIDGDVPSKDFLWRQWEGFRPIGAPPLSDPCVVVTMDYRDGEATGNLVLEDFQEGMATNLSSSGTLVSFNVANLVEDWMRDNDSSFTWTGSQPMNGMTRAISSDLHRGVVFDWNSASYWEVRVPAGEQDMTDDTYVSFRACQGTRHPNTNAVLGDLTFMVTLRDVNGISSSISCGAHGGGIEQPYRRAGSQSGAGAGWANEMETIRIRLSDFLANGSGINMNLIEAVRLDFGGSSGSFVGRLGLDDIEIIKD